MKLKISGSVEIDCLSADQERVIKTGLSLINPVYAVMKRQGNTRALYAIPQYIKYYKKTENGLEVGRGVVPRLLRYFDNEPIDITSELVYPKLLPNEKLKTVKLRDYQEGITEEILKEDQGIIKLGTGFGKTFIAMKMIELSNAKTLIIVPRLNLLTQFKSDIKNILGYDCGVINGKKFDVKGITVATIQTLKMRDLRNIRSVFGMVIYDECHVVISEKGMNVIKSFNSKRLYGMSGTPDRSDGQGEAIQFMFGDILVDKDLPQSKPTVHITKFDGKIILFDNNSSGCTTYSTIIDAQVDNLDRNRLIRDLTVNELNEGRRILILTKRTRHYDLIDDLLPACRSHKIRSGIKAFELKRQDDLLQRLREGDKEFDVILGTFSLLSTGINIPALDTIIFAGDIKSNVLATQSVGRILRLFEGKQSPKIIDINDTQSGILNNQSRLRKKFYKSNGWEII